MKQKLDFFVVVVIQRKVEKPKRSLSQKVNQLASHQDPDIYLHPYYYKVEFLEVQMLLDYFGLKATPTCSLRYRLPPIQLEMHRSGLFLSSQTF